MPFRFLRDPPKAEPKQKRAIVMAITAFPRGGGTTPSSVSMAEMRARGR